MGVPANQTMASGHAGLAPVPSVASSLLFPLEVEEGTATKKGQEGSALQQLAGLAEQQQALLSLLRPTSLFQSKLLRDVRLYKNILRAEDEEFDVVSLAARLSTVGYRVHIRTAIGGGHGTDCFHNLRHEFLVVQGEGDHEGVKLVVEPAFAAQFQISHSTSRYDSLLAMLPSDIVTTTAMLAPLVRLLCAEMQLAFESHGVSLPPWRQSKSMLSKWLPQKSRDFEPSPYGSPRAASPEPSFALPGVAASSGCTTPHSTADEQGSPRAVLASASAVLISQASEAHPQPPKFKAKSLLSDRLAAATQQPAAGGVCLRRSSVQPSRPLPPPPAANAGGGLANGAFHTGAGSGMVYRVEPEWLEPPIRKVKMQGPPAALPQ